MSLLDIIHREEDRASSTDWRPKPLPSLDGVNEIELDLEAQGEGKDGGLKWWEPTTKWCGFSLCFPDGTTEYHPVRHRGEPYNHDEAAVRVWFEREVRGKRITNLNIRIDNHWLYQDGIDLEAQDNRLADVGHQAALLDDHRKRFSLAALVEDFLPGEEKVRVVNGRKLDETKMAEYPAAIVAVRAEADVRQVHKLRHLFRPRLVEEDLLRVLDLEEQLIYPVCEMERNAAPLDLEKLTRWRAEVEQEMLRLLWKIWRETALRINPDSSTDWEKLYNHLKIPIVDFTEQGNSSFTDEVLRRQTNPIVQDARRAGKLADLLSKSFNKFEKGRTGNLYRYALHQLRSVKDPRDDSRASGTVSGRFSSTEPVSNVGGNIQQILAVEKQVEKYGSEYIVRELFIPGEGRFLSADAAQIEYRIFADKAGNPRIIKAYEEDPDMSFHVYTWEMIKVFKPDLGYKPLKNLNFAEIYNAGLAKKALMLGFITDMQFRQLKKKYSDRRGIPHSEPLLEPAKGVQEIYDRELPEVKPLQQMAMHLAMPCCTKDCRPGDHLHQQLPHRGFVRTILGRRARFPNGLRVHKALNGVIQGTGGDILKTKIVELHRARKYTGLLMRHTEHDEVCGDALYPETEARVREVLNSQSFSMKVPIRWDVKTGANWKECIGEKELRRLGLA